MEREEFKILVKGMKAVYTKPDFLPDKDAFEIWYNLLRDLNYSVCSAAIQSYMMTNKFPPTIADIRQLASDVQQGHQPDWGNGWEQVVKNISKYGMCTYDPERLVQCKESFDPITRKVVERLGWKELCMSENPMADRANFRMIYEQIAEREKKNNQISGSLKLTMNQIREGIQQRRQKQIAETNDVKGKL